VHGRTLGKRRPTLQETTLGIHPVRIAEDKHDIRFRIEHPYLLLKFRDIEGGFS